MADRRETRLAALRTALAALGVDGALLTCLPNIRYLTGFSGSNALVAVTASRILLITDFRYQTQVKEEVGDFAQVIIELQSVWSALWRHLPAMGATTMAFESAHLAHREFARLLQQGDKWMWRPATDLVEALRERKDADEIAAIERAAAAATGALARTLPQVKAGLTELQIAGILEREMREGGSEGYAFETIVASGERSALPHARAARRAVRAGEFLLFDFGAVVDGYVSDVTRTVVVGRATAEQRAFYDVVREANARAAAGVRAGMPARDADGLARSYIEGAGFGELFGHGLGHGIGLEVHEAPRLARTAEGTLAPGAVVTIEPGLYRPGWGGVRIEDDVVLDPAGPRILTDFPRELVELA
ncbi:MAG TPA: aminopeptidase P family protein [Gemmatimonadaceae bacterium]|nr:aminopeptidase P family protein [Gemmatimonadaceae bacterium]